MADIVPNVEKRQRNDAFDGLKAAVAGWALESQLAVRSHPEGYDSNRDELVLAQGAIAVDLSRLPKFSDPPPEAIAAAPAALAAAPELPKLPKRQARQGRTGAKT